MTLRRRLAKLEQTRIGDAGAGVIGIRRIFHGTGTGPDVVTVVGTGATMTEADFRARYPLGLLIMRVEYEGLRRPEGGGADQGEG